MARMRLVFLAVLYLLANASLAKQPLYFELGGASNSPGIADQGRLIIEEKLFHYDSDSQYNLIDSKFRYGLIKNRVEARIHSRGLQIDSQDAGFSNTSVGSKIRFINESKYLPSTEMILDWQIPLGIKEFRNPGFDHSYMLVLGKQWLPKFGSIVNLSLDFSSYRNDSNNISTATSLPYVFNINYSPKPELNIFSHIFGAWSLSNNLANPLSVDLGSSYALSDDLVLIAWVSKGLNDAAPSVSVDCGLVYRF